MSLVPPRRSHRPALLVTCLSLIALPAGASGASPAPGDSPDDAPAAAEQLFALRAEAGSLATDASGATTLTLVGPDADAIRYADRPGRTAEWLPLDTLVASWPVLFASDPPNAVLSWAAASADDAPGMLVLELGTPTLATDGSSLTLPTIVAPVGGEDLLATDWPDRDVLLALGSPALAIDGVDAITHTEGVVTVVGTPGPDSIAVSVTVDGTLIGSATLTMSASSTQIQGTVDGTSATVIVEAEIPTIAEMGMLLGDIEIDGPAGATQWSGMLGSWPGPVGG